MTRVDEFGQPVGERVDWSGAEPVRPVTLAGRFVRIVPVTEEHAPGILSLGGHPWLWTYLAEEPPRTLEDARAVVRGMRTTPAAVGLVVLDPQEERVLGRASYLRIQPGIGSVEVGAILLGPALRRTRAATEVQHLLMRHAFDDLGYRRYEWKCDSLNAPSRRAAARLGFIEEGTWRNALVTKGRTRDTTWFSVTDAEWPRVGAALTTWLDDANHDEHGGQRRTLEQVRAAL